MKEHFINDAKIRGYVFSHTLQERESTSEKTKGQKYIFGNINVATDEDLLNVVPISFFVNEKTSKGTTNATFTNLRQIIEEYQESNPKAMRVRVDGSVDVNDFYSREGELVSAKRVRGSFLHFLNANEEIGDNPAYFEAEALFQGCAEKEGNQGDPYLELKGFVFNYRGDVLPVTFTSSSEAGMAFFENCDITTSEPYFGKVWGKIVSTVVEVEKEADDSAVGFGTQVVQPTTRTFRTWEIIGANVPAELDESTVTLAEVAAKLQEREGRLAELKSRTDERNASAQGQAGFPAAAATPKKQAAVAQNSDYEF